MVNRHRNLSPPLHWMKPVGFGQTSFSPFSFRPLGIWLVIRNLKSLYNLAYFCKLSQKSTCQGGGFWRSKGKALGLAVHGANINLVEKHEVDKRTSFFGTIPANFSLFIIG